jgi:hypothetical protein
MARLMLGLALLFPLGLFGQEKPVAPDQEAKANANSTIVFFREGHYAGSGLRPSIYVDGRAVARLSNGRWFSCPVEPGKHKLLSSAKNQPATVVNVETGKTVYVQMVIVPGTWRDAGRLLEVDADDAQKVIAKLKPNEEGAQSPK